MEACVSQKLGSPERPTSVARHITNCFLDSAQYFLARNPMATYSYIIRSGLLASKTMASSSVEGGFPTGYKDPVSIFILVDSVCFYID